MQPFVSRGLARGVVPRLARHCSFQTALKEMEAKAAKIAPNLPDGLKDIAMQGVREPAQLFAGRLTPASNYSVSRRERPCAQLDCARAHALTCRLRPRPLRIPRAQSMQNLPSLPVSDLSCTKLSSRLARRCVSACEAYLDASSMTTSPRVQLLAPCLCVALSFHSPPPLLFSTILTSQADAAGITPTVTEPKGEYLLAQSAHPPVHAAVPVIVRHTVVRTLDNELPCTSQIPRPASTRRRAPCSTI